MLRLPAFADKMPIGARYAVGLLFAGWALHYVVYFTVFSEEMPARTTYLQAAVGLGICWGVAAGRKWARMLCIFFNIAMIALYGLCGWVFSQTGAVWLSLLSVLVVLALAGSTIGLLRKDTALYFNPAA